VLAETQKTDVAAQELNVVSPSRHESGQKRKVSLDEDQVKITPAIENGLHGVKLTRLDEGASSAFQSAGGIVVSCCKEC